MKEFKELSEKDKARFWSKVQVVDDDNCWEWLCHTDENGYGMFKYKGTGYRANRLSYFIATGIDPRALMVRHSCDNPQCVNPNHLLLGTAADNSHDRDDRGRTARHIGNLNGSVKLTEDDVRIIRQLDDSCRILGIIFKVCPQLISQIRRREIWQHVK